MSEVLFRAKRKDNGEWIESLTLFKLDEHLYMFQTAWGEITYDLQHNITAILGGKKPFLVEVIPETVGRYTGLGDRNSVKIFEGDIVSFNDDCEMQYKGDVYWCLGTYCVDCSESDNEEDEDFPELFYAYICGAKIIGNIHDNPGLLKGEEK